MEISTAVPSEAGDFGGASSSSSGPTVVPDDDEDVVMAAPGCGAKTKVWVCCVRQAEGEEPQAWPLTLRLRGNA